MPHCYISLIFLPQYSINMEANNNSVFSLCPYSSVGKLSPDIWSKIVPEARMYNDYFLIQGDMSYRYFLLQ